MTYFRSATCLHRKSVERFKSQVQKMLMLSDIGAITSLKIRSIFLYLFQIYRQRLVMHQYDKKVFIRNLIAKVNDIKMAVFSGQKWWRPNQIIHNVQEYYYLYYITVYRFIIYLAHVLWE